MSENPAGDHSPTPEPVAGTAHETGRSNRAVARSRAAELLRPRRRPRGHLSALIATQKGTALVSVAVATKSRLTTFFLGCGFFQVIRYSLILAS